MKQPLIRPTREARAAAIGALALLAEGDPVLYDGRTHCHVVRAWHHPDGTGAPGSYGVRVGFGAGRWNVFVSADAVALGMHSLQAL